MTYEAPAVLDLGSVEDLTFGGNLYPSRFDFFTGYIGFRLPPPPPDEE
jgi:hypothetical protein